MAIKERVRKRRGGREEGRKKLEATPSASRRALNASMFILITTRRWEKHEGKRKWTQRQKRKWCKRKWCSQEPLSACGWRPGGARTGLRLRAFGGSLALPTPWFCPSEPWKHVFLLSEANQFAVVCYRSQRKLTQEPQSDSQVSSSERPTFSFK